MGFVVFAAMGLYLLISIGVVKRAIAYAKREGKGVKGWSCGAALVMYLMPFWDWIPTVATHRYYCASEAGFWVYKTVNQWKAENLGVLETLVASRGAPSTSKGDKNNFTDTYFLNSRFNGILKKSGPFTFNVWRWEQELVDSKTGDVLSRNVDFSAGNGNIGGEPPFKFWLQSDGCTGFSAVNGSHFYDFRHQFLGKKQ